MATWMWKAGACPWHDSDGGQPFWLVKSLFPEGEAWYCTLCEKLASEEHLKGKKHTAKMNWGVEQAAASCGASSESQGSP